MKKELEYEEFVVLSELDLKDILNEKLEAEVGNHKILSIFNPAIEYKGLTVDINWKEFYLSCEELIYN